MKYRYKDPTKNQIVKDRLRELQMKQGVLAEKSGYNPTEISLVLTGRLWPTKDFTKAIATVLEMKPWALFPEQWFPVEEDEPEDEQ